MLTNDEKILRVRVFCTFVSLLPLTKENLWEKFYFLLPRVHEGFVNESEQKKKKNGINKVYGQGFGQFLLPFP